MEVVDRTGLEVAQGSWTAAARFQTVVVGLEVEAESLQEVQAAEESRCFPG